jgi:hypothetical protein
MAIDRIIPGANIIIKGATGSIEYKPGLATLFWTNILRTINYFYYSSYPANSSVLNSLYSTGVK